MTNEKGEASMKVNRYIPGISLLMFLLALVLVTAGCSTLSDNSPTAPGETGTASTSSDTYAEALIRADVGGTLQLGVNVVSFPPGALNEDTLVSIVLHGSSTPFRKVFDLYPDGIQFNKSVSLTLTMGAPGIMASGQFVIPAIYYFNEGNSDWENIGGRPDFQERTVTTRIEHFSRYSTKSPWG